MERAALHSLDDLEKWFHANGKPLWNVYRGHLHKKNSSFMISKNETETDLDQSFEDLKDSLEMQGRRGGKFTVFVCAPDARNTGLTTFLTLNQSDGKAAISGNGQNYMGGIYGNPVVERMIREAREDERQKVHLERDLEDVKAALEAQNKPDEEGFISKIGAMLVENPEGAGVLLTQFAASISQVGQVVIAGIHSSGGSGAGQPSPGIQGSPLSPQAGQALAELSTMFDLNVVLPRLLLIAQSDLDSFLEFINSDITQEV